MSTTGQWTGQYRPAGPASPRHHPDEVASDSAPAGAAVDGQLGRSRQLYPGWRWSTEQQQLRQLRRAQQHIGRRLDQLSHAGAVVLHARRFPTSAQPLDHLIVTAGATFAVVDLVASRRDPIGWTSDGHLIQTGIDTEPLEAALALGMHTVSAAAADLLGPGWTSCVVPVLAIAGPWPHPPALTNTGIMVGAPAQLRRWMTQAFVPVLDAVDIAVMANAVARACPSGVAACADPAG